MDNGNKIAFVFGATGQIGSYLSEYLCDHQYKKVIGVARRTSTNTTGNLESAFLNHNFTLVAGDITDPFSLTSMFNKYVLDKSIEYEVYNLAAQSHVAVSFHQPKLTADVTGLGHLNILESVKLYHDLGFKFKNYFMSSSETYGSNIDDSGFQTSSTPMFPNSPYAAAKLYAFHMNRLYREAYGMWNTSGIIFNTESPRRGENFVTRKITKWFAEYANYMDLPKLQLGNIKSCRDWTHAKDTVRAIHMINTAPKPKDYIVASGETHSIYNFMEECYAVTQEYCFDKTSLNDLYEINADYLRPNEVPFLRGKADAICQDLGWKPEISFKELVREMFVSDYYKAVS